MIDNKLTHELEEKIAEGMTADELIEVAKENGIEVTDEMRNQIAERFAELTVEGVELDDGALEDVAGGRAHFRLIKPKHSPLKTIKEIIDVLKSQSNNPQ